MSQRTKMMSNESIYVGLPSMDDLELEYAIISAFENSDNPERVYVGAAVLSMYSHTIKRVKKLAKKYKNLSFSHEKQKKNRVMTLGVGAGRDRAEKLYSGQDYFLQADSHSHFEKGWDSYMIKMFKEAVKEVGDQKVVITCIPPRFSYGSEETPQRIDPPTRYPAFVPNEFFIDVVPKWTSEDSLTITNKKFIPSVKANSAMLFGGEEFINNTGIGKNSIFYDEELIYSINLIGDGFALVFPNVPDFPVLHLDGDHIIKGHERNFFLDYLEGKSFNEIHEKLKENYLSFVKDPKNAKKVDAYRKYSKVDPLRGKVSSQYPYIPDSYRI
jgi:hypothetical protein